MSAPLLEVCGLTKAFAGRRSPFSRRAADPVRAIDDVWFEVEAGQTFGLVGESGSGKTTIARCLVRLVHPDAGRIAFDGIDVLALRGPELRRLRRRMQIVFQDPSASLDPRMTVGALLEEPLVIHGLGERAERRRKAAEMLDLVGLMPAHAGRKPHEFSGGQRQRIALARALVLEPELLILDEPVSALDVSVQAQILNLLRRLQAELRLTVIFVVHDLAVAQYFCDRVAVVYRGAVMELAGRERLFQAPQHPYTQALLSAAPIPEPDARGRPRLRLRGEIATEAPSGEGCRFQPRCFRGHDRQLCAALAPPLAEQGPHHLAACHFPGVDDQQRLPAGGTRGA